MKQFNMHHMDFWSPEKNRKLNARLPMMRCCCVYDIIINFMSESNWRERKSDWLRVQHQNESRVAAAISLRSIMKWVFYALWRVDVVKANEFLQILLPLWNCCRLYGCIFMHEEHFQGGNFWKNIFNLFSIWINSVKDCADKESQIILKVLKLYEKATF